MFWRRSGDAVPGLLLMSRAAWVGATIGHVVRGQRTRRVIWRGDGRLHIAVQGVSQERGTALARATEAALRRHPAVSWAAVNAPLGTVVAACSDDVPAAELISVVEQVERNHAVRPETAASRPGAIDRVPQMAAPLAAGVAAQAFALV